VAPHLTVIDYDRRGGGNSGDTAPNAIDREVEDIEALVAAAGGSALVFGQSSGRCWRSSWAAEPVRIGSEAP
jgi:hypothetical protein